MSRLLVSGCASCGTPCFLRLSCSCLCQRERRRLDETTRTAISRLQDKNPLARIEAILDIRRTGLAGPPTAAALIASIQQEDNSYVRDIALEVLGSMASDALTLRERLMPDIGPR